jgi:hypothetical protein
MSVSAMDRLNVPHLLARITSLSELFANSFCEQMCKSVAKDNARPAAQAFALNHDSVECVAAGDLVCAASYAGYRCQYTLKSNTRRCRKQSIIPR